MKLKSITINNIKLFLLAQYRKFIKQEYNRIFTQDKIDDMLYKVSQCSKCYNNGIMECCGCNFKDALLTNKHCKHGKF